MDYFDAPNGFHQRRTIQCTTPPAVGDNPPENTVYEWFAEDTDISEAMYLVYRFPDGSERIVGGEGVQGPPGPPGGPPGPQGASGPAGYSGATGATGPAGPVGATGATGAIGATGATGPVGATGPLGNPGPIGSTGPTGTGLAMIMCRNDSGEKIPPHAIVQVDGNGTRVVGATGPNYYLKTIKPDGAWPICTFVNTGTQVEEGAEYVAIDGSNGPILVLIINADPGLDPGAEIGPVTNSWYARVGYPSIGTLLRVEDTPEWTANHAYAVGDRIKAITNVIYTAVIEGVSGSTIPAWPGVGLTVNDGTITWLNTGTDLAAWIRYHTIWLGPRCEAIADDNVYKDTTSFTAVGVVPYDNSMSPATTGAIQCVNPGADNSKGFCFDNGDTISIEPCINKSVKGVLMWRPYDGPCGDVCGGAT